MEIRVVVPITTPIPARSEAFVDIVHSSTRVTSAGLSTGPVSIESEFDEAFAVPETIIKVMEAEAQGADAVVIDCAADPALGPAREAVSIPVVGAMQSSVHLAAQLAHRFSIVTITEDGVPAVESLVGAYGLSDQLASVRAVEIPVLELDNDPGQLISALVEQSTAAITTDGAHAIVFGCTGMKGYADALRVALGDEGWPHIPVIDPISTAVKTAELLVTLSLSHSKRTYPTPGDKRIDGYDGLPPAKHGGPLSALAG